MIDKIIIVVLNRYVVMAAMLLIVLFMGLYVASYMDAEIMSHPEVTQVGAPLKMDWVAVVAIGIVALVAGIIIVVSDGGINPGANKP